MALGIPQGFILTSNEPIDSRLVLTKAQMLGMIDAKMPDTYFAVCADDGELYIFQAENEKDNNTGKFRKVNADLLRKYNLLNSQINGKEETSIINRLEALEEQNPSENCCVWIDV